MTHLTQTLFQKYFGSWLKIGILVGVLAVALVFFYTSQEILTTAEVSDYYPATCLGSWQGSELAQGEPDTLKFPENEVSSDNSAFVDEASKEIYCGQFLTGDFKEEGEIKDVRLTLVWKIENLPKVVLPEATVLPESTSTENNSAGDVLPTSDSSSDGEREESVEAIEEVMPPNALEKIFTPLALAQETDPVLTPKASVENPVDSPVVQPEVTEIETTGGGDKKVEENPDGKEAGGAESGKELSEPTPPLGPVEEPVTELIFNPTSAADESFLRVSYSLDGQEWRELSKVDAKNWFHFTAALGIKTWEELKKLQFKIEGIPTTLEGFPEIYLDGMFVEVQYERPPVVEIFEKKIETEPVGDVELPEGVPLIVVPEEKGLKPAPVDRKDFSPNESPSFDFDLENLPSDVQGESTSRADPGGGKSIDNRLLSMDYGVEDNRYSRNTVEIRSGYGRESEEKTGVQSNSLFGFLQPGFFMGRFFLSFGGFGLFNQALAQEVGGQTVLINESNPVVAQILDEEGRPTRIAPTILNVNNRLRVNVPEPKRSFRPGNYTLKVWVLKGGKVYLSETNFTWGVFAINFDKSIYKIGDVAHVGMAVLSETGKTLCDAQISLRVVTPVGSEMNFSTRNGSIDYSLTCGPDNVTNEADYKTEFGLNATGTYKVFATTRTANGLKDFEDRFEVQEQPKFDVVRSGATRIYPPASYIFSIKITPNQDFKGVARELVPAEFDIIANQPVDEKTLGEEKILTWNLDLRAGEKVEVSYIFKAPNVSPEFYKLGPLSFYESDSDATPIFLEARSWQIAADQVTSNEGSMMVYGDAAQDATSTYRLISSTSTTGSEVATVITGAARTNLNEIKHVSLKAAPTRQEFIAGQLLATGRLYVIKASGTTWTNLFDVSSTITQICDNTLGSCNQTFDVAYEQLSGDALIAYGSSSNDGKIFYRTWDGNVSSSESSFTFNAGSNDTRWVRLVPKGSKFTDNRSDEIMLMYEDAGGGLYAALWDGTQFVASTTLYSAVPIANGRPFDGAWETNTGNFIAVYGSSTAGTPSAFYAYKKFSGGAWGAANSVGSFGDGGVSANQYWVAMDADALSDRIAAGFTYTCCSNLAPQDSEGIWKADGATEGWTISTTTSTLESTRVFGQVQAAFERSGVSDGTSTALFTMNVGAAADAATYRTWIPSTGFSAAADIAGGWQDDGNYRKLIPSPNNDTMVWLGVDSDNDLNDQYWSGTAWHATGTELNTAIATTTEGNANPMENNAFDFAWKPYAAWSRNWRLYAGTSTADTPSPALAAENTSTTIVGTTDKYRLRFNVAELGGNSQTDARKKLQWTTSTNPDASSTVWTDVGNIGSSTIWRYFDPDTGSAVGNDGTVVAATVLSSSTTAGWWNTSKNAAAGTSMDHASTTIVELEFPFEANSPDTGYTYYFRMYDVDQVGGIYRQQTSFPATTCATAVACTYPAIVVSAVVPVSGVVLNNGNAITLLPNTTTTIYVNFTVTDLSGCSDVFSSGNVTTTIYRSGVSGTCTADSQNCYRVTTTTNNCAGGNSANGTSTFDVYYFAQATDASSSYSSQNWEALVQTRDGSNNTSSATSTGVELNGLLAIELVTSTITYGSLNPTSTTGAVNKIIPVRNVGNSSSSIQVYGSALKKGSTSIATSSQHYASSSFIFGGTEGVISNTATTISGLTLVPNTTSTNSLGSWGETTVLPCSFVDHASVVYKNYLYQIGGVAFCPGIQQTSTVRYAQIASNGTIGSWTETTAFPSILTAHAATTYNGYMYVAVGGSSTTVKYASISSNGTIGTWTAASDFPNVVQSMRRSLTAYGGYIYLVGFNASSTVYYAKMNTDGSLGSWGTTTALPDGRSFNLALASNGYLYSIAGKNSSGVADNDVYYAAINADGTVGTWGSTTVYPTTGYDHDGGVNGGYIYVTAGEMGGGSTNAVYYGKQNADGTISAWDSATSLSTNTNEHTSVVYNDYLYVLGGYKNVGSTATSSVFYAQIRNGLSSASTFWGLGLTDYVATGTYQGTTTFIGVFSN